MKTRAKSILTMTASALILLAPARTTAATAPANASPTHTPATQDKRDTVVYSATKSLIESVSELSKTASKLSETALKLLEAQEELDARHGQSGRQNGSGENLESSGPLRAVSEEITEVAREIRGETNASADTAIPARESATIQESIAIGESETMQDSGINGNAADGGSIAHVYISDEITSADSTGGNFRLMPEEYREGGQYLWIPDQRRSEVEAVLDGSLPRLSPARPDLSEMTFWRGDSIPMALPTKRLGRYDRKLYNWLIYPKGLWHISLTANYGELKTEDMELLTIVNDIDLSGKIYSIKPSVSYFLRNNLCVGMRLAFTKGDMGINSFKVDIDEDMSFNLHDIKYTSDSYSAAIFLQQYFGLTRRGRFAVFNEAEVSYGSGSSHFIRPFGGEIRDTRTKSQSFNINYSPGVSIMMMKNAAFNLSFGIFGFHLKNEKQWENGEESGSRFTSGINFRFNLFNINFGVSIII